MKRLIFLLMLVYCSVIYCQLTYDWNWAQRAGGTSSDIGKAIATDSSGNVYVTGMYQRTAAFGSITLTDDGSHPYEPNIFVAKMDPSGNWLWAKKVICNDYHSVWVAAITVDINGNCIIVGQHDGASFGTQIASNGDMDGFIAKLDTNGNWLWAKTFGGSGSDAANGVGSDNDGNVYVTGRFSDTVIVDTTLLISAGSYDVFVVKMDGAGNWVWAKRAGGSEWDYSYGISTDDNGTSFVTGSYRSSSSFGSVNLSSSGADDIFAAKIDSSGNWLWANGAGGVNGDEGTSITCDSTGNVYLTGTIGSTASFGSTTLEFYGYRGVFVAKLNANGIWQWALQTGSSSECGIGINNVGDIYVAGQFQGTLHYGTSTITAVGATDIFIGRLDCYGNWLFMKQVGSVNNEEVFGVALENTSSLIVTGRFSNSTSFGTHNMISNGNDDVFVAKFSQKSPTAAFSTNTNSGLEPLQVQFSDLSFIGWGSISSWHWDFGDGFTSNDQNPLHIYENDGVYSVSLVVTNSYSLSDTLSISDYFHVFPRNPEIALRPGSAIDFGITNLGTSSLRELWIRNSGTATLQLDSLAFAQANSCFVVDGLITPAHIAEGDSIAVEIRFTPLDTSAVTDSLIVYNNSINGPRAVLRLRGIGQSIPPLSPQNVSIEINGENAMLSWDAVTLDEHGQPMTPDYYFVYLNGIQDPYGTFSFLGRAFGTSYTHYDVGLGAEHMFYRVKAIKLYRQWRSDAEREAWLSKVLKQGMSEAEVLKVLQ